MILRKPYAFLIKNFKRIHFGLGILMGFLSFKTSQIYSYFNTYIAEGWYTNSNVIISDYLTVYTFLLVILTLAVIMIIFSLLYEKKKPRLFYIFSIIAYIYVLIVYLVDLSNLNIILREVIDSRQVRLTRDLTLIASLLQYLIAVIVFVRSTGFNIKKFDFDKDIRELNIEESDREEVEVSVSVDRNLIRRKIKRRSRRFRYFILENKAIFVSLIMITVLSLGTYIYLNIEIYNKVYEEGEVFKASEGLINITDSYHTIYNYNAEKIAGDEIEYFVVKFDINNDTENETSLKINNFILYINGKSYIPILNKYVSMFDIGNGYSGQYIDPTEKESYILVYEVPKNFNKENIYIEYIDSIKQVKYYELETNFKKAMLEPINLDNADEISFYKLGDEIEFNTGYISDVKLTIKYYGIGKEFNVDDKLLKANTLSNYDKTLLKLVYSYESSHSEIKDIRDFIGKVSSIQYKIGDEYKNHYISPIDVTPKGAPDMYLEVLEDLEEATKVDLVFNLRGYKYVYTIKEEE